MQADGRVAGYLRGKWCVYVALVMASWATGCSSGGGSPDASCRAEAGCGGRLDGASPDLRVSDGGHDATVDGAPPPAGCQITLSGAQSGTFSCFVAAGFQTADGVSALAVTNPPVPSAAFELAGELTAGTYTAATTVGAGIDMTFGTNDQWSASKDAETGDTVGSWTLVLDTVKVVGSTPEATLYAVTGSLVADLPGVDPTGGNVHFVATFH